MKWVLKSNICSKNLKLEFAIENWRRRAFGWAIWKWICLNTMQLEVKEAIKIEVEIWRMWSLNVTLALEFKAKDEIKEI